MEKVLILGGAGFVGSFLTRKFCDSGYDTYIYDANIQYFYPLNEFSIKNAEYRYSYLLKDAKLIRGNSLDISNLRRQIIKIEPDYIVNLAALPLAVTAIEQSEEAFDSILTSAKNILEVLRDVDFVKKYVHVSSSMIYGDFEKIPVPPDARKQPKDIYGSMKLASEYLVMGYAQRHGINYAIVRPSAVYGPTDNNRRVLQIFVENAINGKEIIANNPETNILDFTYVEDAAEAIKCVTVAEKAHSQAFNVTHGEGRSLLEAVEILKKRFPELKVTVNSENTFYPKRGALDVTSTKEIAGYIPQYSLEKGLNKYIDYLLDTDKSEK